MIKKLKNWSLVLVMIYVQIFANSCNNSYIDVSAKGEGKILWKSEIFNPDEVKEKVGYLLVSESNIIVVTESKIKAFNQGNLEWNRERWPHSPAKIRNKNIYYISPNQKSRLEAVDYKNNIVLKDLWIPELIDNSFLIFLEPIENGIIAQIQYQPDPDTGENGFVLYRMEQGKLGMVWEKNFMNARSKVIPIINQSKQVLVTSTLKDVIVFSLQNKTDDPEPAERFPLPQGDNSIWLSASDNLELFWLGNIEKETILKVTDIKGSVIWEWKSDEANFEQHATPIQPAIVSPDICFVLTYKKLFALNKGSLLWFIASEITDFSFATAVSVNSIIVTRGSEILLINSEGRIEFQLDIKERILTAPVVDRNGYIYVACEEHLFCIK